MARPYSDSAGRPWRASAALLQPGWPVTSRPNQSGAANVAAASTRWELDLDEAEAPERAIEEIDFGGVLVDRNPVAGLLQAPFAGVPPQVFCFGEVEVDLDLRSVEIVLTGLDRQPRLLLGDADAHGDVAVDGDVALAQRRPAAEQVDARRSLGDPFAFDLSGHNTVSSRVGGAVATLR